MTPRPRTPVARAERRVASDRSYLDADFGAQRGLRLNTWRANRYNAGMGKQYWLVKEEPESLSYEAFARDGVAAWTGVRNFQARNNLRAMRAGDAVLYYHTGKTRAIVGLAEVQRAAYPDPTAKEGDWSAVDLQPVRSLPRPVPLAAMKQDAALQNLPLLRQSRLSVVPVAAAEFDRILHLAEGAGRK